MKKKTTKKITKIKKSPKKKVVRKVSAKKKTKKKIQIPMAFKGGDLVRVRSGLKKNRMYGSYKWCGDNARNKGEISYVDKDFYNISFDDSSPDDRTCWTDEMLEPVGVMKFKKGDKVKVRDDMIEGERYGSWQWDGRHAGKFGTINYIDGDSYNIIFDDGGELGSTFWTDEMLEPEKKMLDNLGVGDILISKVSGYARMILSISGLVYTLSVRDEFNAVGPLYTRHGIEADYYIPGEEVEQEEAATPTLQQLVDKFLADVEELSGKDIAQS